MWEIKLLDLLLKMSEASSDIRIISKRKDGIILALYTANMGKYLTTPSTFSESIFTKP